MPAAARAFVPWLRSATCGTAFLRSRGVVNRDRDDMVEVRANLRASSERPLDSVAPRFVAVVFTQMARKPPENVRGRNG